MKKLQLTSQERNWLLPLLKERMEFFLEETCMVPAKYINSLESVTAKVSADLNFELKQWENIMISSCINQRLSILNLLNNDTGIDGLTNSHGELKSELVEIDTAYSILDKSENGRYKRSPKFKERTSYIEYFERIGKIKESEIIFLSGTNSMAPYKIAFVHNKSEFCTFELRQQIDLSNVSFVPLKDDVFYYGRKFFHYVLDRKQAFEKLSQFTNSDYRNGQLPFLLQMLN